MSENKKQVVDLPEQDKIPTDSRWKRGGVILFVAGVCGTLFMGLLNFGDGTPVPTDTAAQQQTATFSGESNKTEAEPVQIVVHQIRPVGIDRSKCKMLPSTGSATCTAGEVGMRIGRTVTGNYRRVYCGGCEKLVYPAGKSTTVDVTIGTKEGGSK